jgi:hypothetical protein
MDASRYEAAIERNLAELQRALLKRRAMVAMEGVGISNGYLKVIYYALFNDYIAHCIKVFERSSGAASFWYIYDTNQKPINDFARKNGIDLLKFEGLTESLKHVRDKTHFHIDREGVLDPEAVWQEAGLNGKELAAAVDQIWDLLNAVRRARGSESMELPPYDVDVVRRMTMLIEEGRLPK